MHSLHFLLLFLLPCFSSCQQAPEQALFEFTSTADKGQGTAKATPGAANIVFQSTDGGQTWQDISAGLPTDTKAEAFFVGEGELLLGSTDGVYRSKTGTKNAHWEKEIFLQRPLTSVSADPTGVMAITDNRRFFQKMIGADVWMPIFPDFKEQFMRTVFTAKDGSSFIGADSGLFKSTDGGKTWKHVMQNGWVIEMVESDGVLLCTNTRGILRSTDGGGHWGVVLSEGGVGIDVAIIEGGFAAITFNTGSETRRIRISTDGGKTWQPIDAGLPPSMLISSILQVGDSFFCGHPKGIYRSDDGGKTWQLLLPTIGEKVFNLSVAGGVMYAVLRDGGC